MSRVKRTGLTAIRNAMLAACRLIGKWTPTIKSYYPENAELHLALDTANGACSVLVDLANQQLPEGV